MDLSNLQHLCYYRSGLMLFITLFVSLGLTSYAVTPSPYHSLGCWIDQPTNRDLNGVGYSLSSVTLESCAQLCREEGFPFVGLQGSQQCFCGFNYGKHGSGRSYHCNYTCIGSDSTKCGGHQRNSVYYTVPLDSASVSERIHLGQSEESLTYTEARRYCIKAGGDLSPIGGSNADADLIAAIKALGDSVIESVGGRFWFGMFKRETAENLGYEFTDPRIGAANMDIYVGRFASNETFIQKCVYIHIATQKWYTAPCNTELPFVCFRKPIPDDVPTQPPTTESYGIADDSNEISQSQIIAFYVVVPLFCACYGGSCVAYAAHKLYKSCKKKRRKQQKMQEEFEADTRPFMGQTTDTTRSRPITSRDIKVGAETPPYLTKPMMARRPQVPERSQTPVQAFTIDDSAPPRAPCTPKPIVPHLPADNPPPYSPPRSSLNILPPDSGMEIDFTKLSIQDIIQIKMIMGQTRSQKPKKIISS